MKKRFLFWLGLSYLIFLLVSCDSQKKQHEKRIEEALGLSKYFSNTGRFSKHVEIGDGGWLQFHSTSSQIEKYIKDKGLKKFRVAIDEGIESDTVDHYIQFTIPKEQRINLNSQSFRFRGQDGSFGIHGFYNPTSGATLICFYGE